LELHAWHLPGLGDADVERIDDRNHGSLRLLVPVLRAGAITRLAARLGEARRAHLVHRRVDDIVDIIDEAVVRITTGETRATILDALPQVTGFSRPMAQRILDGMARDWRAPALRAVLDSELGGVDRLDTFVDSGAVRVRAFGPPLVGHILAGNVPGVGVTSLIRALLVKSASVAKTSAREPVLAPIFARAVAAVDAGIGRCLAVTYWPGGEPASHVEAETIAAADAIVVYGGEQVVAAVRAAAPASKRIIEHGPKLSFGVVGSAVLRDAATARSTARAVAAAAADFDQHGCVSPHFVFVQDGSISAEKFAGLVAQELTSLNESLPRGTISAGEAARIRDAATRAEFRAIGGEKTRVHHAASALIIYDALPALEASCLNRTLYIKRIAALADVVERVAPYRDVLQSVAFAGIPEQDAARLAADLAAAGVTRITDFERLAWPPAPWHHDGRGPLVELIRFVDDERPRLMPE
jgi:hypothetical protein